MLKVLWSLEAELRPGKPKQLYLSGEANDLTMHALELLCAVVGSTVKRECVPRPLKENVCHDR